MKRFQCWIIRDMEWKGISNVSICYEDIRCKLHLIISQDIVRPIPLKEYVAL